MEQTTLPIHSLSIPQGGEEEACTGIKHFNHWPDDKWPVLVEGKCKWPADVVSTCLVIRTPLALCCIPHIRCGGDHPPNSTAFGKTLRGASLAPVYEGHQGAEAAPVSTCEHLSHSHLLRNAFHPLLGLATRWIPFSEGEQVHTNRHSALTPPLQTPPQGRALWVHDSATWPRPSGRLFPFEGTPGHQGSCSHIYSSPLWRPEKTAATENPSTVAFYWAWWMSCGVPPPPRPVPNRGKWSSGRTPLPDSRIGMSSEDNNRAGEFSQRKNSPKWGTSLPFAWGHQPPLPSEGRASPRIVQTSRA